LKFRADYIKDFKEDWQARFPLSDHQCQHPTVLIDSYDVGVATAHILAQEDRARAPHNETRYVLNGLEDVTGEQIIKMVEQYIGESVKDVKFKDVSFIGEMADNSSESKNVMRSIKFALVSSGEGKAGAETTSKEILELYALRRTVTGVLRELVEA
jgi:hypothetical protein